MDDSSSSSSIIDDDIPLGDTESIRPRFIVRDTFDVWSKKFSTHDADKSNETLYLTPRRSCKHAFKR